MHVGVHDALYRQAVLLMDRVAGSLDAVDLHIAKMAAYNEVRLATST